MSRKPASGLLCQCSFFIFFKKILAFETTEAPKEGSLRSPLDGYGARWLVGFSTEQLPSLQMQKQSLPLPASPSWTLDKPLAGLASCSGERGVLKRSSHSHVSTSPTLLGVISRWPPVLGALSHASAILKAVVVVDCFKIKACEVSKGEALMFGGGRRGLASV